MNIKNNFFECDIESQNFEHAIRLAVSLGGDSDTLAAITGSIAEAFYGEIPTDIIRQVTAKLPPVFSKIIARHKIERYLVNIRE